MLARLAAYRDEHGDCDVKKKYQRDPALGGWVAAVRRCRSELGAARVAELDQIGFVWQSSRSCGSAWMSSFRELRAFHAVHGHSDVGAVLGRAEVVDDVELGALDQPPRLRAVVQQHLEHPLAALSGGVH